MRRIATLALAVAACGPSTQAETPDAAVIVAPEIDAAPPPPPDAAPPDAFRPDGSPTGPIVVSATHWKLAFDDDFRGKQGQPFDEYCFDVLKPQCHIWAGTSHNCDLSDVPGQSFYPPTRANLIAAISVSDPAHDFAAMSDDAVKSLYGTVLDERLAALDKCNWTSYEMVNWMATDYSGHWSARFDPSQIAVDPSGKGYLQLSATRAPVDTHCIFGGGVSGPNCQIYGFSAGELTAGVAYVADPDPRWPGVYYAPVNGACPHGGTFTGVNCLVHAFAPHFLEETGVPFWVDADPRWPGVYYADQTYRCKENIDYEPNLGFRNLTCPILDGGVMSYEFTNKPWVDLAGSSHPRGEMQKFGRFEAKARLPKGIGAFPATWLMPREGGWPYDGGEIDVLEARDNADEVYQTYHHGKCYAPATGLEMDATDSADCTRKGGKSTHLSKGYTTRQVVNNEFWQRDHLYAVEWTPDELIYYINDREIGRVAVGTVGVIDADAPPALAPFESSNFPTQPFYWILNHSTYVPPASQANFVTQVFNIDYIRNYVACGTDNAEYCPRGGRFYEDSGCEREDGSVYPSPCQPARHPCVNGGSKLGTQCLVKGFDPGVLEPNVTYWVDSDPRWPGVYYHKVSGMCPFGGSGEVNCQIYAFAPDVLESGVVYRVDTLSSPAGVYYSPDFFR